MGKIIYSLDDLLKIKKDMETDSKELPDTLSIDVKADIIDDIRIESSYYSIKKKGIFENIKEKFKKFLQ